MSRNALYRQAISLIRPYQAKAPIRLSPIADALGVRIMKGNLPIRVSGEIYPDPENSARRVLCVNRHHFWHRQRYSVAHMIAHFLLHPAETMQILRDDLFYRSRLPPDAEAEANRFAADILMPWDLMAHAAGDGPQRSPIDLANLFDVSETAMKVRLSLPT